MRKPIRVYNPFMDLLHETDDFISLQFKPRFYDIGEFELHINQYIEGAEYFQKNNILMLDKQNDKVMIIKHREIALDESGKVSENWKITGYTLEGVLNQRITIPPSHTDYDRKSGDAETVMKHYVERHFVNPDDPKRKISHIEIAPNKHRGQYIEWESRYKNVGDEIVAISKQANLGWTIYADMVRKKWIFDVIEPRDLTQDNPDGNPPVFFSPDFSTIKNQTFVDSESNYKNVAVVGGEGEGTERKIVTVGDSAGLERLEVFIDARDIQSTTQDEDGNEITIPETEIIKQLQERGKRALETDYGKEFYLEAQILTPTINDRRNDFAMSTPFEYEKDFRLGDVVQVFNKSWNITMDVPITEFNEIYEADGFVLEATFGEAVPTLITKIKREFDDLKGVEKQELPVKVAVEQMKQATEYTDKQLTKEQQERIKQAQENLNAAKNYTVEYAEQKILAQDTPPENPKVGDKWVDTSENPPQLKLYDGVKWYAIKGEKGDPGKTPVKGVDYFDGKDGQDGQSSYLWIRYSNSADGSNMTADPTGALYIGIATTNTPIAPSDNKDYQWSLIKGEDGIPGEKGADGRTSYLHIKYSDDGGKTFTANNGETVGAWMGTYVDFTQADSTNPADYTWNKVKGEQGPQGLQGPPGADGKSLYTWVKYADDVNGNGMSDYPDGKKYIGLAYNKTTPTESANPADYTWALIQGPQGVKGTDGQTYYTWIKYADSPTSGMSDDPTGKKYMGIAYNKTTPTESANYADYSWSLIQGPKGDQGPQGPQGVQGPKGADGQTLYTWIKYADSPTSGMSDTPTGKKYIGLAYNKTTPVESSNYADYSWSLIQGPQGVQGPKGADGVTTYTWVKYADDDKGAGMSDSPNGKRYLGLAYNKTTPTESTNPADYSWSPLYDNVQVGVRNLYQNSKGPFILEPKNPEDPADNYNYYRFYCEMELNETYTISADIEITHGDFDKVTVYPYPGGKTSAIPIPSNGRIKHTFVKTSETIDSVLIYAGLAGSTRGQGIIIRNVKLEKGNVATDWAPAPEDTQAAIDQAKEDAQNAQNTADDAKSTADSKAKTFTSQPIPPYKVGDIWKNGTSTYICIRTRTTGTYNASDWQKTGDVTSENTAKDTQNVNGVPAEEIKQYAQWGKTAYDNQHSAVTTIDSTGVNVKNGAFTLEEDTTNVRFNVSPARNLLVDHSFEMLVGDGGSIGSESVLHNWLEIKNYPNVYTPWVPKGNPKVATQFAPDSPSALAIFGSQAVVLANAQYVRQYVRGGIAAGGIYTLSAYFKRQWQCDPGGTPYLEVWVVDGLGNRLQRIAYQIFEPVPSDYSVVRRAVTFTVPTGYQNDYTLEVIVSNGEAAPKWIQCDGVQLVEGSIPSIYQPEDSVWHIVNGEFMPILQPRVLWAGAQYPIGSQTIYPTKDVFQCPTGWILKWQSYTVGSGINDRQYSYTFIPKQHIAFNGGGKSLSVSVPYNAYKNTGSVFKYLYIYNDRIVGHDQNNEAPNNNIVLSAVYEF